jgi:hypothetical protein
MSREPCRKSQTKVNSIEDRKFLSEYYGQKDHRLDMPTLSRISADAAPQAQEELLDVPTMSAESTWF